MSKKILYIFIFLTIKIYSQQFTSCNKGLSGWPTGLYNDTVLKKLIVFGNYGYADGLLVNGMATWDGNKFDSLGSGVKTAIIGNVGKLIRYKNKLYAQFSDWNLHSYDYNTNLWSTIPGKFDGFIQDATIFNNELILAGDFQNVGELNVRSIIKYNGVKYDTLPKPKFSFYIRAVEVYKNELYIGGNFDPQPFPIVAKFNGQKWISPSEGLTIEGGHEVTDFEIYNEKLFMFGKWTSINGEYSPSIASWDGQRWNNLGGLKFKSGQSSGGGTLKAFNNKLFVFGHFEMADTINAYTMAVWNDTIWCKATPTLNFTPGIVEIYKGDWYISGPPIFLNDTVNWLGKYIGNNGKLEGTCFDKPKNELPPLEIIDGIYPNPFNASVNFNLSLIFGDQCNLKIINQLGQTVADFQNINSNSKIDLSIFSKGFYLFIFEKNGIKKPYKLLKE